MNIWTTMFAAAAGYLAGSISFSRVVTRIAAPHIDLAQAVDIDVPGGGSTYRVDFVSPTAVSIRLGPRYGFLAVLLDNMKVVVPALAFRLAYPGSPYHLIVAVAGLLGNDWPLYHHFKGGKGMSVIYAGLFVIDWLAVPVTALGGFLFSLLVVRNVLVTYTAGLWLLIPWLWFRTHDPIYLIYAIVVNIVFMVAAWPDARQYLRLKREGRLPEMTAVMERHTGMWRAMMKITNRLRFSRRSPSPDPTFESEPER